MATKYDEMKRFYAENSVAKQCVRLCIAQGEDLYLNLSIWEGVSPNAYLPDEAMLNLKDDEARSLMNALWIAGVRPTKELLDKVNHDHLEGEIKWLRSVVDKLT